MKYLKIIWVRIIICLFAGGLISELIHVSTGDPNRPMRTNLSVIYGLIVYGLLTFIVRKWGQKTL